MRESRKNVDKNNLKFPKTEAKKSGRVKEGYRRRTMDGSRRKTAEGDVKGVSEIDGSSSDMPSTKQLCNSPAKSEDSSESSDQSASSGNVGGSSSQSSIGSRGGQYGSSSANKKHGIAGIKFQPGLRLEAKDLGNDIWYAVKVVEVDWEEEEILIHFEKWSQRYDEWIPMDSSRLRPIQEPTGGLKKSSKIFKVGDKVMATWSDSRKYPAKVKTVLGNDRYEVLFFDGFSKNIKGGRMTFLKDEELASIEQLKPGIGPSNDLSRSPLPVVPLICEKPVRSLSDAIGTKEERRERKRKLNVAELFHFKKRPKLDSPASKSTVEGGVRGGARGRRGGRRPRWSEPGLPGPESSSPSPAIEIKKERKEDGGEEARKPKRRFSHKSGDDEKPPRKIKMDESGQKSEDAKKYNRNISRKFLDDECTRKEKGQDGSRKGGDSPKPRPADDWEPEGEPAYIFGGARKSIIVADPRIPAGWARHTIQRMSGHSAGKWDVFFVSPQGRKFRTRHELRMYYEDIGELFPTEQFDFSLGRRRKIPAASTMPCGGDTTTSKTPAQGRMGRNVGSNAGGRPRTPFGPGSGVGGVGGMESGAAAAAGVDTPVRRVKTLLPRVRPGGGGAGTPDGTGGGPPSPPPPHLPGVGLAGPASPAVPPSDAAVPAPAPPGDGALVMGGLGGLRIERENDAYKCPKEGCNKNFRKENLLQMHLKHYHPEYNRFVASTPNVADLAYARTVGEPIDELMPHPRFETASVTLPRRGGGGRGGGGGGVSGTAISDGPTASPIPPTTPTHPSSSPHYSMPTPLARRSVPTTRRPRMESEGGGEACGEDGMEAGQAGEVVPKPTIKTLLPVVRPALTGTEAVSEDLKSVTAPTVGMDGVEAGQSGDLEAGPPLLTPAPISTPTLTPGAVGSQPVGQTKSLRTVRRRYMSDFHMEPLLKRRKTAKMPDLIPEDVDVGTDESSGAGGSGPKVPATYRFSRKKMPVVHLEKLQVTTDSNELEEPTPIQNLQPAEASTRQSRVETLRREELINCTCGYPEEDGLMIQCDLCLCWQHGLCNSIEREEDVPEKYVCFICLHPPRERRSKRFLHDQDWVKEGALPSLSFRSKKALHVAQREAILKRSHELTGTLLELHGVVHSLRVKVNIAEKLDHPKLYLWARSWEKGSPEGQREGPKTALKMEVEVKQEPFRPAVPRGELDFPPPATATEQPLPCDPVNDEETSRAEEETDEEREIPKAAQSESEDVRAGEKTKEDGTVDGPSEASAELLQSREPPTPTPIPSLSHSPSAETKATHVDWKESGGEGPEGGKSKAEDSEGAKEPEPEPEPDVELPLCQSELMDLATSMASSMIASIGPKAHMGTSGCDRAPPRAPQPEAPIDPVECRLTLLDHIEHFQQQIDSRLTSMETQIVALESMDPYLVHDESSDPRTKETVQMLLRDLATLRDVAALN